MLGFGYLLGKVKLGELHARRRHRNAPGGRRRSANWACRCRARSSSASSCCSCSRSGSGPDRSSSAASRATACSRRRWRSIIATTGLVVAYVVSRLFGYDAGTAAGVIAGALTESATIGTASDAIARLGLPAAEAAAMTNRIPVAFAVTYLIGVVGAAWFLAQLAPRLMGVNLEEECRRYEQEMQGGARRRVAGAPRHRVSRLCRCSPGRRSSGQRIRELEAAGARRAPVRRAHPARRSHPRTGCDDRRAGRRHAGGRRPARAAGRTSRRAAARRARSRRQASCWTSRPRCCDVVVTRADLDGRTLADLAEEEFARSVFLRRITRAGTPVADVPGDASAPRRRADAGRADAAHRRRGEPHRRSRSRDRRHRHGARRLRHRRRRARSASRR